MRNRALLLIIACAIAIACLSGCGAEAGQYQTVPPDAPAANASGEAPNMVDERFELLSLVFRLAGHDEYGDADTDYQRRLGKEFGAYGAHAAVQYAAGLALGYDAVFNYAVHIQKDGDGFELIDDIGSLVEDGRWTRQTAADFIAPLNDFYAESGFAAFYIENAGYYQSETRRFIDDVYSKIDLAWFEAYVNLDNLRCVYSPSNTRHNYGATVNGAVVYCAVSGDGVVVVHEYCHSFANSIAHMWYNENPEFKKWCDDTIDPVKLPSYGTGQAIAGEYVTRAYNALYYAEHGYALAPLLLLEKGSGFAYIEEVYAMIAPYEKLESGGDKIKGILGADYEMGEEQTVRIGSREIRWRVLALSEPIPGNFLQNSVGNALGSKTGDVLYVEYVGEGTSYLMIDLGETTFEGRGGYRKYSVLSLD